MASESVSDNARHLEMQSLFAEHSDRDDEAKDSATRGAGSERALRVPRRIEVDPESLRNGLGQLVLTLVKLLHELLEKQAIRRMENDTLTDPQIEKLGLTLMQQAEEINRLREVFGLKEEDLNLDLGPLGKLL